VAAKTLGVSKGTIITYLNKGLLTRIKEEGRIYIEKDEVRSLGKGGRENFGSMTSHQPKQPLSHCEQFEKESQARPSAPRERKHKELARLESELDNLRQNLAGQASELAEAKMRIKQLEKNQQEGLLYLNRAKYSDDHSPGEIRVRLLAVEEELQRLDRSWWKRFLGDK
jgi:hypothetical protein